MTLPMRFPGWTKDGRIAVHLTGAVRLSLAFGLVLVVADCSSSEGARSGPSDFFFEGGGAAGGAGAGAGGSGAGGGGGESGGPGGAGSGAIDPGPPEFPSIIGHLSVAIRNQGTPPTGSAGASGAPGKAVEGAGKRWLCLAEDACFELRIDGVDEVREGEFDVYHFDDVGLPRSDVDRVELRFSSDGPAGEAGSWRPACIEVRFDGEPVHCGAVNTWLGVGPGLVVKWASPSGLSRGCSTCYPDRVTHGPLVGAVGPDRARILVRTDATRSTSLHLAPEGESAASSPPVAWKYASPLDDYTTVFDVEGLEPARRYVYAVNTHDGLLSKGGSFVTAPADDAHGIQRFSLGSGAHGEPSFHAAIVASKPDFFLLVGDNHEASSADLAVHRWHLRHGLEDQARSVLAASVPTLATWSERDFVGVGSDGASPGKDVALRAFREYWANPSYGTPSAPGVFSRHRWGQVEFFLLDDRSFRGATGVLGGEQKAWLEEQLLASTAAFKLLISGTPWGPRGGGQGWEDAVAERDELLAFVRDRRIGGVVLVGGSGARSEIRLLAGAPGGYDLPELVAGLPPPLPPPGCEPLPGAVQIACHAQAPSFFALQLATGPDDASLSAMIVDNSGVPRGSYLISRAQLEVP